MPSSESVSSVAASLLGLDDGSSSRSSLLIEFESDSIRFFFVSPVSSGVEVDVLTIAGYG